jgi:hypothetical protein
MNDIALINFDEPLWISTLREQCEKTSQGKVATVVGYSPAVINQVLKRTYKGDVKKVELAVRGAYLGELVGCPVMGDLPTNQCLENQRRPYASTNPQRIQLYRACRNGCVNSQLNKE